MKGWIKLHRQFMDNPLWKKPRVFSQAEAWLDLLMSANGVPSRTAVGLTKIDTPRGCILASIRYLARRWSWSRGKTERYIAWLKTETMIGTQNVQGQTLITITKYEDYNGRVASGGTPTGTPTETPVGQKVGQTKEGKQGEEIKETPVVEIPKLSRYESAKVDRIVLYMTRPDFDTFKRPAAVRREVLDWIAALGFAEAWASFEYGAQECDNPHPARVRESIARKLKAKEEA